MGVKSLKRALGQVKKRESTRKVSEKSKKDKTRLAFKKMYADGDFHSKIPLYKEWFVSIESVVMVKNTLIVDYRILDNTGDELRFPRRYYPLMVEDIFKKMENYAAGVEGFDKMVIDTLYKLAIKWENR